MALRVSIDSIPERMKALNCWAVWKTEKTENRSKQKVCYYTHKSQAYVGKPKTWTSFDKALVLLDKYPEFEGLSFVCSGDLGITGLGCRNTVTKAVHQIFYKFSNPEKFSKSKKSVNPFLRRGGQ